MTTIIFCRDLRGEMVQCSCEVYRSHGQICYEEEMVVDRPWEITDQERAAIQESALAYFEQGDV